MSKPKTGFSNDRLYGSLDNNYADNVNFFSGKEVVVEKVEPEEKPEEKPAEEKSADEEMTVEEIDGIESIVRNFGQIRFQDKHEDPIHDGNEGLVSFGKSLIIALWEMIKDIGRWIRDLFTNKLARVDSRIRYTEQRRKIEGIKDTEVKYPYSIKRLMIPSKVSIEPDWTYNCADVGIVFYRKILAAHQSLKSHISKEDPGPLPTAKRNTVENAIARIVTGSGFNANGVSQTDILPGNRIFNVRAPLEDSPDSAVTFFTESMIDPLLKSKTFMPTPYLIDNAIKTLREYRSVVGDAQKTSSELQRKFESEVSAMMKGEAVAVTTRTYMKWLVNTNKRLLNGSLQHAIHTMEALDDFINAGLR